MKEACEQVGITYGTLKFYCNEGLVPNVKRDKNNHRKFDERDIQWLKGLQCLKKCGMSIQDMKHYMNLCLEGVSSIPKRKELLATYKDLMLKQIDEVHKNIDYINHKQVFFDSVLSEEIEYTSLLTP